MLKLDQRAWALSRGVNTVTWTFDPLLRRNGWFNLTSLGAVGTSFLPNFYGELPDGLNAADDSDRLFVQWELESSRTLGALAGMARPPVAADLVAEGASILLDDVDGEPVLARGPRGTCVLVHVPRDLEALRGRNPNLARRWRQALREVLAPLLVHGAVVNGMTAAGYYVVSQESS